MGREMRKKVNDLIISTLRNRDVLGRNVLINRVSAIVPKTRVCRR